VHVAPLCPTWLTENPSIVLRVQVQQSFDNEATWEDFAEINISPPQVNHAGDIPFMGCQVTDQLGARRARILLTVSNAPLACGVDIIV